MTEAMKTLAQLKKASKLTRLAFHKNGPKSFKRGQGALLKFLLEDDGATQRDLVKKLGVDRRELKGIVKKAERNGYAFDHSESVMNGTCIAVPIRNYSGTIIATLSFSGFIGVEDTSTLLPYLEPLREASERITSRLYATWKH